MNTKKAVTIGILTTIAVGLLTIGIKTKSIKTKIFETKAEDTLKEIQTTNHNITLLKYDFNAFENKTLDTMTGTLLTEYTYTNNEITQSRTTLTASITKIADLQLRNPSIVEEAITINEQLLSVYFSRTSYRVYKNNPLSSITYIDYTYDLVIEGVENDPIHTTIQGTEQVPNTATLQTNNTTIYIFQYEAFDEYTILQNKINQMYNKGAQDQGEATAQIDIRGLMLNVLTMPFTFLNKAFDVTLWPNTQYAFNIGNFIKGLIAIAAILFIIRLFTTGFSIIGNYTGSRIDSRLERQEKRAKIAKTKAETANIGKAKKSHVYVHKDK